MNSMGTGTKIGFILILILVVVVIVNLIDSELQSGPTGKEQVTGRQGLAKSTAGMNKDSAKKKPITAAGTRLNRPVRQSGSLVAGTKVGSGNTSQAAGPTRNQRSGQGQISSGTANPAEVGLANTSGVLRGTSKSNSGLVKPVVQRPEVRQPKSVPAKKKVTRTEFRQIKVQSGDSLWRISERYLGDGKHYRKIIAANSGLTESTVLQNGNVLRIPIIGDNSVAVIEKPKSSFSAGTSTYVIQDGDSLWRIAEQKLGSGLRHAEIKLANPNVNLDVLKVGMEIRLP
ncbi:MAG: LysM peptidoglycan-binding domain-containing protein [Proteobacteria bacterium]|jgi:nucleoid-associated protein YgaU|nr:LysM peptidoglycan-binding domain-containing protein [Planctomycetia bacterium]NCG56773.1 LysM peptidoglycan-binding domain-containing protein [Pseudomonadota bacterium]